MSLGRTFKLNSGYEIPAVGLGTWLSQPNEVESAVEHALRSGYRHIDAAACYLNENEVGNGWKKSGVPREEIFITSKLWNTHHGVNVEEGLNKTLKDLQTDYLDLYLIHWPVAFQHTNETNTPTDPVTKRFLIADIPVSETWAALEKFVEAGKIRSIGISNFTIEATEQLLKTAKIRPVCNQIEAHPYLLQPGLTEYLQANDILPVAYSPLGNNIYGRPRVVDDPTVVDIAKKLNKDPAQVLIAWAIKRGSAVLPKSVTPSRIESNFQDFELPDAEFAALNKLDRNERYNYPFRWGIDVFGELGDAEAERRAEEHAASLR